MSYPPPTTEYSEEVEEIINKALEKQRKEFEIIIEKERQKWLSSNLVIGVREALQALSSIKEAINKHAASKK